MFKGIIKISLFAILGIAGCTDSKHSDYFPATESNSDIEFSADRFLENYEESHAPDFVEHIAKMNTAELHDLAESLNWDFGIGRLFAILDNPNVDRGTALMIYWRNAPYYQAEYKLKKEASKGSLRGYELHMKAEYILLNRDFKTYNYPYNFARDLFFCPKHTERASADTKIPQEVKVMDGPNMDKAIKDWCSGDERMRVEKNRADNGFSYHYEDPYADFKISRTDGK